MSTPVTTERESEHKGHSPERAKGLMMTALRGRDAKLTRADAIVASGLSEEEAGQALTALLKEYRSHLSATESGELLYEFDPAFERRDALSLRERAAAVGRQLWKGFTLLFKLAIVTTLVSYFVAFVAMMVAMVFARSGSSDRDDDGGFGFDGLLWFWGWDMGGGNGYGRQRARFARPRREPLYKRVFAFVFGPPKPADDPLADEKQIVGYIRAQRGRIAAVDLVRLMGWTFPRAEQEVTRLMIDYGGEPEVTEEGVVLYTFKAVRKTAGAGDAADMSSPCWARERLERPAPLTGNEPGTNAMIVAFNGFNLLAPFWIVPAFESRLHVSLASWQFLLWDFPLAFSAVFFAIPAGRWFKARLEAARLRARNSRRELLGRIFSRSQARPREELAPTPELAAALDRELVALGGDIAPEPDDQGRILYTFPRIDEESAAVARARAAAPSAEQDAGLVVFSSAD